MRFDELNLHPHLLDALKELEYTTPTPIQEQSIPHLLEGRDLFGCAQTGTGKTAAFALPILYHLEPESQSKGKRPIRCLILAPTRELAGQINDSFKAYGKHSKLRSMVIFGGVNQNKQVNQLSAGVDILVATPGRLLDLMNQGFINLTKLTHFVLDEADRMLDMGFIHDVKKILPRLPKNRQSIFFSATISPSIMELASTILIDPENVRVNPVSSTAEIVSQYVLYVEKTEKRTFLKQLIASENIQHAIIFTRTKHGADRVARELNKTGMKAEAIHGDKSQNARERALEGFKNRTVNFLVATDIASRGIDIDQLEYVINYEIPEVAETYVHRIGRTGRAGSEGTAFTLCATEEKNYWKAIQKLIQQQVPEKKLKN